MSTSRVVAVPLAASRGPVVIGLNIPRRGILISKHPSLGDGCRQAAAPAQLAPGAAALGPITGYAKMLFLPQFWPPSLGEG